jgi:methionine sulfoxide reductase heme-binding subunit
VASRHTTGRSSPRTDARNHPPFGVLVGIAAYITGRQAGDPAVTTILTFAEIPALLVMMAALWCTPLGTLTGRSFGKYRKAFGVGFGLAAWGNLIGFLLLHPLRNVTKPFAVLGTLALAISAPLVFTSSKAALRRLGPSAWKRLHRAFYITATLTVTHLWLVPQDDGPTANAIATVLLVGALGLRVPAVRKRAIGLRKRRCGSLLSLRTWVLPS